MKYRTNQIVKGTVSGVTRYGIFLNFEAGYSGMIHISEISNKFVLNITDYAQVGETLTCKILDLNQITRKMRLSIKELDSSFQRKLTFNKSFFELQNHLSFWISQKIKEINQENNKNH